MPSVTTSVDVAVRVIPFPVAWSVSAYEPTGVIVPDFDVVTWRVVELPLVVVASRVADAPAGSPVTDSVTGSVKYVRLIATESDVVAPCLTDWLAGDEPRLKLAPYVTFVMSRPLYRSRSTQPP